MMKTTSDYGKENDKLRDERDNWLDAGRSLIDFCIELENRLWRMEKENVDKNSAAYLALKSHIEASRTISAFAYYRENGWHHKHSGEWVPKESKE